SNVPAGTWTRSGPWAVHVPFDLKSGDDVPMAHRWPSRWGSFKTQISGSWGPPADDTRNSPRCETDMISWGRRSVPPTVFRATVTTLAPSVSSTAVTTRANSPLPAWYTFSVPDSVG